MAIETVAAVKRIPRSFDPLGMYEEMARFWSEPGALLRRPLLRSLRPLSGAAWSPMTDMFEKNGRLILKTDLPGMKKDEIDLSVEGGDLIIKGERKEEKEVKEDDYYRMERSCGSFYRRIELPFEVDAKAIQAKFEDGVLQVEIPKPAEARSQPEKVKVR